MPCLCLYEGHSDIYYNYIDNVGCLLFLAVYKKDLVSAFCMMLIALGAISNLIDRMIYGFVIDYFDVRFFSVLNLADIMITLGVMIFIVFSFYSNKMKSN